MHSYSCKNTVIKTITCIPAYIHGNLLINYFRGCSYVTQIVSFQKKDISEQFPSLFNNASSSDESDDAASDDVADVHDRTSIETVERLV